MTIKITSLGGFNSTLEAVNVGNHKSVAVVIY